MTRKTEYIYNSGVNSGLQEESNTSNLWTEATYNDFGVYAPVFYSGNLYINFTGTFVLPASTMPITTPANDSTNWRIIGSGSHVRDITVSETDGVVTITVTNTEGVDTVTSFSTGHVIKKDGSTAVSFKETLSFKGINLAVANVGDDTVVDFTIGDTKLTNTILATTTNEGAISTLDDEVEAIKKVLSQATPAHVENLFTIPAEEANWQNGRFSSLQPANIGSAGAVTRPSVDWAYGGAPITGDPIIGYVYQGATIPPMTGKDFVYANIGVALSSSRHGELISILDDLVDRDALDTLVPNEDDLFLVNDNGERYTPFADASEGSSNGIKVFRYPQTTPDPHPSIRLFSITFAILFDVGSSHYDNQAEVIAQIKNKGLRAFFIHANTDVGSITKLKAAVRLNEANIEDNTDQLAHLPNNEEVFAANDGQILAKTEITEAGKVAYMSFVVAVPNAAHANETVEFTLNVVYPTISPLNDIADIKFDVEYVTGETASQVATKIVAAINAGTNAELVKFRDGQTVNGKTYGKYNDIYATADKVVIASEDVGVIYNAIVTGEIDSGDTSVTMSNLTNLGHGTGGIFPKVGFIDQPSAIPVTQIANAIAYEARRAGDGWTTGELMTPTENFDIVRVAGTPTIVDFQFTGALTANGHATMSGAIAAGSLFEAVVDGGSLANYIPSIRGSDGADVVGAPSNYTNAARNELLSYSSKPASLAAAYGDMVTVINAVTTATAAGNPTALLLDSDGTATTTTIDGFVTATTLPVDMTATSVRLTATRNGVNTIAETGPFNASVTPVQAGTADTSQTFTTGRLYQRTAAGGWFEYNVDTTINPGGNL